MSCQAGNPISVPASSSGPPGDHESVLPSVNWSDELWDLGSDPYEPQRPCSEELLDDLVSWLRDLKSTAGLSYADMARKAHKRGIHTSVSTFSRAGVLGRRMTEDTAVTFAEVCGGSAATARKLWAAAHTERALETAPRVRRPGSVRTRGQFAGAMRRMLARAGAPTLRQLEVRGGTDHRSKRRLPRSSVALALRKRGTRLPSVSLLEAFLQACSVPEHEARQWMAAHRRLAMAERARAPQA